MNKQPFMAGLQGLHSNGEVLAWDPEEQEWYPVTGATYDGHEIKFYAQFIAVCSAYNLAVARRISLPWQGSLPAKTQASSRPFVPMDIIFDLLQTVRN